MAEVSRRDGLIHMAAEFSGAESRARGMRVLQGDLVACVAYLQVKGASGGATGPSGTTPAGAHHSPMVTSDQF
jgi:hypothetical protein